MNHTSNTIKGAAFALLVASLPICAQASVSAMPGTRERIGSGLDGWPCVTSEDRLGDLRTAASNHDTDGAKQAAEGASILSEGEGVLVIKRSGFLFQDIELRIRSGSDEGMACWIPADISNEFKSGDH